MGSGGGVLSTTDYIIILRDYIEGGGDEELDEGLLRACLRALEIVEAMQLLAMGDISLDRVSS